MGNHINVKKTSTFIVLFLCVSYVDAKNRRKPRDCGSCPQMVGDLVGVRFGRSAKSGKLPCKTCPQFPAPMREQTVKIVIPGQKTQEEVSVKPVAVPTEAPQKAPVAKPQQPMNEVAKEKPVEVKEEPSAKPQVENGMEAAGELAELKSEKEFNEFSKASYAVIEVYAPWCGPCKTMVPRLKRLAKKYEGKISFGKLNGDSISSIRKRFNIDSYPRFYFYKNGKKVHQTSGGMEESIMEHHLSTAFPELKKS